MEVPHLGDFINRKLKDIYHDNKNGKVLVLEFDNNYKLLIKGVGAPDFKISKERKDPESEEELKAREKEKRKALSERKKKESQQKNRKKEKK